jgi:hypothetical protein
VFDYHELAAGISHKGQTVTLAGPTGSWIPKGFDVPVSLRTTIQVKPKL